MNETATEANALNELETVEVGDVLIIGAGEKATRHTVTEVWPDRLRITPILGGNDLYGKYAHSYFDALLQRGALSIEKKPKPYKKSFEMRPKVGAIWQAQEESSGLFLTIYGEDAKELGGQDLIVTVEGRPRP